MQKLSIPHLTKGAFSLEAFSHVGYLDGILEGKVTVFVYCNYSDEESVSLTTEQVNMLLSYSDEKCFSLSLNYLLSDLRILLF